MSKRYRDPLTALILKTAHLLRKQYRGLPEEKEYAELLAVAEELETEERGITDEPPAGTIPEAPAPAAAPTPAPATPEKPPNR